MMHLRPGESSAVVEAAERPSAARSLAEPEAEAAADEDDAELRAVTLLAALAQCPFGAMDDDARVGPTGRCASDGAGAASPSKHLQQRSSRAATVPGLDEAALEAIRTGAALVRRGCGTQSFSAALAQPQGLGGSVRAMRARAAEGDATAREALAELDAARRSIGLGGISPDARARRLRLALAQPDDEPCRLQALEEAALLCGVPPLCPGAGGGARGEPEDEDSCDAIGLLGCVRSEIGLREALATGEVEF